MEHDEITLKRLELEADLEIASLIQPLPKNVIPSDEFLRKTRLRLLNLEGKRAPVGHQAAA